MASKEEYWVFAMIQGLYKDATCNIEAVVLDLFLLIFPHRWEEFCVRIGDNALGGALKR